jgi:hypothetical protein
VSKKSSTDFSEMLSVKIGRNAGLNISFVSCGSKG